MEQLSDAIREVTVEVPNRKLENILRETFSPKREAICRTCSLRPEYCFGSVADFHRCRYALRIDGGRVVFPSEVTAEKKEKDTEVLTKEIEDLIIKTLRRVRVLTMPAKRISS
jgi:hypothetical protein